jgi:hypothetical protein
LLNEKYEALVETNGPEDEKQALAAHIGAMLTTHATVDEELFLPGTAEAPDEGNGLTRTTSCMRPRRT